MTTTNEMVTCPKCSGSGKFYFWDGREDVCFRCDGLKVVEASEIKARPVARHSIESVRLNWRARYRNARAGRLSYEDMIGDEGGYTAQGVVDTLASIGATEAFRALGWPV